MVALQASIGTLNDLVDAPRDVGRFPPKPIPAGSVPRRLALPGVVALAGLGLGLCLPSGVALVALAVVGLAVGYGYDLVFKGTAWSWLPFSLGIPLLPVFAWIGVGAPAPPYAAVIVPTAMLAGAALAIANARADVEQDRATDVVSVATELGLEGSWRLASGLLCAVVLVAGLTFLDRDGPGARPVAVVGLAFGGGLLAIVASFLGRRASPGRRERAWELQAVGLAVLGVGYLAMVAPAGS